MENQVPLSSNRFTLAAYGTNPSLDDNWLRKWGRPWCDHSRKPGHTKGIGWKLHNKLIDWKPRDSFENLGFMSIGEEKSTPWATLSNKEQMKLFQKLINQQTSSHSPPESISTGSIT